MTQLIRDTPLPLTSLSVQPFSSAEAWRRGWTRRGLQRAVDEGQVRRIFRDVYVATDAPDTTALRLGAVRLMLPPHAVVVDRTAAWLWGVETSTTPDDVAPLDICVLRGNKRIERDGILGGERDLVAADVTSLGGIDLTTPCRTALDLACRLHAPRALAALDGLSRTQDVTVFDMLAMLPRFRGRRGVVQARALVPITDSRAESTGESFTRFEIVQHGLPRPVPQFWVSVSGVPTFRLDLAFPRQKIAVEYDGVEHHTSPEQRAADEVRRTWLRDHGWIVIVVTKDDFSRASVETWIAELRGALALRGHWGRLARA